MNTLILPVAGKSSRFPGMRPKWLLTMPDGKLMVEKAVEKIDMSKFSRVVLVCLREHIENYLSKQALVEIVAGLGHSNAEACILEAPTASQSETVTNALIQSDVKGAFYIKDCDNMFEFAHSGKNEISVMDLNDIGLIDAKNKSYVAVNALGHVSNIVEKQVISNFFCCGGYGFESTNLFLQHHATMPKDQEVYISHIIYSMLMSGEQFTIKKAAHYIDWGTVREYRHYTRSFITLFCDIDGVLFYNGSKFGQNGWRTQPIVENLDTLQRLQATGQLYLVITSSRPESQIEYVTQKLKEYGVHADRYIMGLPHTRRILVNDFSITNPFPSSISVNLERDSKLLSSILDSIAI